MEFFKLKTTSLALTSSPIGMQTVHDRDASSLVKSPSEPPESLSNEERATAVGVACRNEDA